MTEFDKAAVDKLTGTIIDAAMRIHTRLGPGLLESAYQRVLTYELQRLGLDVKCQRSIGLHYDDLDVPDAFRVDMLVNDLVIVELKSLATLTNVYRKQVITYLRLMDLPVGLLINFGNETLKQGIHKVMNGYLRNE